MPIDLTELEKQEMNYHSIVQFAKQYSKSDDPFELLLFKMTPAVFKKYVQQEETIEQWSIPERRRYEWFLHDYHEFIKVKLLEPNFPKIEYSDCCQILDALYTMKIERMKIMRTRATLQNHIHCLSIQQRSIEAELSVQKKTVTFSPYAETLTPPSPQDSISDDSLEEVIPEKKKNCCIM